MVSRVVVGFDGSEHAIDALRWATGQARRHRAVLVACAVVDRPPTFSELLLPPEEMEALRSGLADRLSSAVDAACDDFPVQFQLVDGGVAAELVAACRPDDLLVLGSRGHSRLTGLFLGSVCRACLHHAPCPVVIVPRAAPATEHGLVVVGVDASADSREALLRARDEARLRGAEVLAVHVVQWDAMSWGPMDVTTGRLPGTPDNDQLRAWGRELLEQELERTGVQARTAVVLGHAGHVLVEHSAEADLLVLGSRGHNPLSILVLGSTSDFCARQAACPVMVVRSPQER